MAIMSPFQGEDAGSIPATRSISALSSVGLERLVSAQKAAGSSPAGRTTSNVAKSLCDLPKRDVSNVRRCHI